jgi:hypothetical protein
MRAALCMAAYSGIALTGFIQETALRLRSSSHYAAALMPFSLAARDDYDVIVVGGTPSGVAAALAASRRGAKVLLIEERPKLGGDIVYAMLNMFDVMARPGETSPVHGIFAEFFEQLGMSCDIDRAQRLFTQTTAIEPNLHVLTRTRVLRVIKDGGRVSGLVLREPALREPALSGDDLSRGAWRERTAGARVVIDATNDADIAARAGAGYYIGRESANRDKRMQAAGLLFSVSGVNWSAVRDYVRSRRLIRASERPNLKHSIDVAPAEKGAKHSGPTLHTRPNSPVWLRLGGAHGNSVWERGDIIKGYRPRDATLEFLSINFGRQSDGSVVLNTLNIIGVNGLNSTAKQRARTRAAREIPLFLNYLRRRMPGFAHARLARIAPELYIRETRHINGFYALKVEDVRGQKRFYDRIAMTSYPLDLHPYQKGDTNPFGPRRYFYTLPLRALVPRKVDGIMVASRSLSATYSAAGSARVIPVTMAAGEAAGAAAQMCARDGFSPHDMMRDPRLVGRLQADLRRWGADIGDSYPNAKIESIRE